MYKDINDNELIMLTHEHNDDAKEILYLKYAPLISKKCYQYQKYIANKGIDFDDLYQECLVAFDESIWNYNENDNVKFFTFTNICLDRKIIGMLKKINNNKHKALNEAISLDKNKESDDESSIIDCLSTNEDIENNLIIDEEVKKLYQTIQKVLSPLELEVFKYRTSGYSYEEISQKLGKSKKAIDNAIQRIKKRLLQYYSSEKFSSPYKKNV